MKNSLIKSTLALAGAVLLSVTLATPAMAHNPGYRHDDGHRYYKSDRQDWRHGHHKAAHHHGHRYGHYKGRHHGLRKVGRHGYAEPGLTVIWSSGPLHSRDHGHDHH